jgi:hypothetical protein
MPNCRRAVVAVARAFLDTACCPSSRREHHLLTMLAVSLCLVPAFSKLRFERAAAST